MVDGTVERLFFVLFGAVLAWLFQQYRVLRAEDSAVLNDHIKDVEKFRDISLDYWLNVTESKNKDDPEYLKIKDLALAAKVRAAHAATTILYETIITLSKNRSEDYKRRSRELYDLATGGAFESHRDGIDPTRALEIFDSATRLIHLLREIRRDVVSLNRLAQSIFLRLRFPKFWKSLLWFFVLIMIVVWPAVIGEGENIKFIKVETVSPCEFSTGEFLQ